MIAGYDPADPVTAASQGKGPDSHLRFLDKEGARGARLGVVHQLFTSEDADPGVMARVGPQRERFPPPRANGRCRAAGDPAVLAAKNATSTIPIVFSFAGDPVKQGLVVSFARPGGNLTGMALMFAELIPKRFELLTELVPLARVFALIVNPNSPGTEPMMRKMQEAARVKGVQLHVVKAGSESEIDAAFATLVELHAGALVVSRDPLFNRQREQLVALAARHAVPAIYPWREFTAAGAGRRRDETGVAPGMR